MFTEQVVIIRLVCALILGGIIGLEREFHGREAGFRTHILVTMGSALFTLLSLYFCETFKILGATDPSRIAAQVVTGIGFLGAGAIIRSGTSIRGLTTAASLWAMAGVGMATGAGFYSAALVCSFLVFSSLVLLTRIDRRLTRREIYRIIHIESAHSTGTMEEIRKILSQYRADVRNYNARKTSANNRFVFEVNIKLSSASDIDCISNQIMEMPSITKIEWIT